MPGFEEEENRLGVEQLRLRIGSERFWENRKGLVRVQVSWEGENSGGTWHPY